MESTSLGTGLRIPRAILGPPDCGKTTPLRLVAGLLQPTAGTVFMDGRVVAGPFILVPPEERGLGMVFQGYALWPHLSVADNVAFPLEMAGVGRAERERRVTAALDRVGLAAMSQRNPSALSGGQQQRVAIARAIVGEPRIVLFDELLSNLDRELRETMVAEFLRLGAVLAVRRAGGAGGGWSFGQRALGLSGGPRAETAQVLVTPRALVLADVATAALAGEVLAVHYRDTAYAITVRLADTTPAQTVQIASNTRMRVGERIGLEIISDRLRWFPAQTDAPLNEDRTC